MGSTGLPTPTRAHRSSRSARPGHPRPAAWTCAHNEPYACVNVALQPGRRAARQASLTLSDGQMFAVSNLSILSDRTVH